MLPISSAYLLVSRSAPVRVGDVAGQLDLDAEGAGVGTGVLASDSAVSNYAASPGITLPIHASHRSTTPNRISLVRTVA